MWAKPQMDPKLVGKRFFGPKRPPEHIFYHPTVDCPPGAILENRSGRKFEKKTQNGHFWREFPGVQIPRPAPKYFFRALRSSKKSSSLSALHWIPSPQTIFRISQLLSFWGKNDKNGEMGKVVCGLVNDWLMVKRSLILKLFWWNERVKKKYLGLGGLFPPPINAL